MAEKYFGTDGIRGRVGSLPLTPDFVLKLGWAAGKVLGGGVKGAVIVGKDTRRSGYLFESALEAGLSSAGVDTILVGPVPTPGIAFLTRTHKALGGIVISASHNPHFDNGIKFFSGNGDKLTDEQQREIEALLEEPITCEPSDRLGRARRMDDAIWQYTNYCLTTYSGSRPEELKVVIDCANGAAYKAAPAVFRALGCELDVISAEPDGYNINENCGSTHMGALQKRVVEIGADVGIALDGDADRCLVVDHLGNIVDGDEILFLLTRELHQRNLLRGPVVGTLMSNLGLEKAITAMGITFERAAVGDRYVMAKLKEANGNLGGETSGHILCLDKSKSGDGIVTSLQIVAAIMRAGTSLREAVDGMKKYPQLLINVRLPEGKNAKSVLSDSAVIEAQKTQEKLLGDRGRVLLRASGTEPLVRVMVESDCDELTSKAANVIADAVKNAVA